MRIRVFNTFVLRDLVTYRIDTKNTLYTHLDLVFSLGYISTVIHIRHKIPTADHCSVWLARQFSISHCREFITWHTHLPPVSLRETTWRFAILLNCFVKHNFAGISIIQTVKHDPITYICLWIATVQSGGLSYVSIRRQTCSDLRHT
jgi:hypothetical protein